jgi:putative acyl-CoA dehydrogenase
VNSIWEGSGNVMCLDVLRAFGRSPATAEVIAAELALARGAHPVYDSCCDRLASRLLVRPDPAASAQTESGARALVAELALAMSACVLLRHAPDIGDLFCQARLAGTPGSGLAFGTLPDHPAIDRLIDRFSTPDVG